VILTRAPLRISIAGGGTDLPSYYLGRGTSWISGAINKYCYCAANYGFANEFLIKYSNLERVQSVKEINHNLIRETLVYSKQSNPLELTFSADLPGGTGLGSSSAFIVSQLAALHAYNHRQFTARQLAEEATHVEREILNEPIGLQDQYISALGGVTKFEIDEKGSLSWERLQVRANWYNSFAEKIFLFYTGKTRNANEFLGVQESRTLAHDKQIISELDWVKDSVNKVYSMLIQEDFENYGRFLNEYWLKKREREVGISSSSIDDIYSKALKNGAVGGKLIGAGGSGFFMFIVQDKERIRKAIDPTGLFEVPISFDQQGACILIQNN
jgi:D-glycero-alpha-D-manno-heptose-7-phosphate kinase